MSKSIGKIFEQNWKASIPEGIFVYRPPDAAQSFQRIQTCASACDPHVIILFLMGNICGH